MCIVLCIFMCDDQFLSIINLPFHLRCPQLNPARFSLHRSPANDIRTKEKKYGKNENHK